MPDLNEIAQDYSDLLNIIQSDNSEIAFQMPILEAQKMLLEDPDNLEGVFTLLRTWMEEKWIPAILEQSTEAQKQAIQTAGQW